MRESTDVPGSADRDDVLKAAGSVPRAFLPHLYSSLFRSPGGRISRWSTQEAPSIAMRLPALHAMVAGVQPEFRVLG